MIAGLVLNLKPQFDKIGVWFTDCDDVDEIAKVKADIVSILQVEEKDLEYEVFQEISNKKPANNFNKGKRGGFKKFNRGRGGSGANDEAGGFERAGPAKGEDNFFRAEKGGKDAPKEVTEL